MSAAILRTRHWSGLDLPGRGYHAVYRQQETNHCPGCGRTHWLVGRISAECGFCATALPFATAAFASERCLI